MRLMRCEECSHLNRVYEATKLSLGHRRRAKLRLSSAVQGSGRAEILFQE